MCSFRDDGCDGALFYMRERDMPVLDAEFTRDLRSAPGDLEGWLPVLRTDDLDIRPADALRPSGSQRLQRRFLRREPCSEVLVLAFGVAVRLLAGGEDAFEESFGVIAEHPLDACGFHDVHPVPDDHDVLLALGLDSVFFSFLAGFLSSPFLDVDSSDFLVSVAALVSASFALL